MNKVTRILLAIGLILAVATPALAEFKLNGYYRLMGYSGEVRSGTTTGVNAGSTSNVKSTVADSFRESGSSDRNLTKDEKGDSRAIVDQRLRMQLTYTLNDSVAVVYFGEVDTVWGESSKGNIGGGGKVGADGVNVETKNVYLDLKSGDFTAKLGVQTAADAYQGVVFFDDMAGAKFGYKMGNTTLTAMYSKWDEDANRSDWDDKDFWTADVSQKFSDNFNAGASVYFLDDNDTNNATDPTQDLQAFVYGVNADAKFGMFGVNGFFLFQDGEYKADNVSSQEYDTTSYMASIKASVKLNNGDVGLRVIYVPEADDDDDDERWFTPQGRYDFYNENLMQFLVDKFVCNWGKERYAMEDGAEDGYGLLGFVLSGNHKLPSDMYLNWGAGYFMTADDTRNIRGNETEREGDEMGYEVAVRIGKKYFEKVDVSLNASYAGYGDFYDKTAVSSVTTTGSGTSAVTTYNLGEDPDDTYKAYLMVNVPF